MTNAQHPRARRALTPRQRSGALIAGAAAFLLMAVAVDGAVAAGAGLLVLAALWFVSTAFLGGDEFFSAVGGDSLAVVMLVSGAIAALALIVGLFVVGVSASVEILRRTGHARPRAVTWSALALAIIAHGVTVMVAYAFLSPLPAETAFWALAAASTASALTSGTLCWWWMARVFRTAGMPPAAPPVPAEPWEGTHESAAPPRGMPVVLTGAISLAVLGFGLTSVGMIVVIAVPEITTGVLISGIFVGFASRPSVALVALSVQILVGNALWPWGPFAVCALLGGVLGSLLALRAAGVRRSVAVTWAGVALGGIAHLLILFVLLAVLSVGGPEVPAASLWIPLGASGAADLVIGGLVWWWMSRLFTPALERTSIPVD